LAEWFAEDCRFCGKERSRIALAVVEATTNIIRHAYGGKTTHPITLRIRENRSSLVLEFLDRGRAVNPGDVVPRRSERLEPGGLGLRILETCVDDFRYEKRSHGGARLILRKRRGPPSPPAQETGQA
jgi:anti-sigma regulatory factor (Ser/Thr protein kinase)